MSVLALAIAARETAMARWSCVPANPTPSDAERCEAEGVHERLKANPIERRLHATFDGEQRGRSKSWRQHTCVRCGSSIYVELDS